MEMRLGRTAQEIRDALQFSSEPERLISGLGKHMQQTQAQVGQSFLYKVGNGIFVQEGDMLNKTYSDIALNKLYSKVTNVDFRNTKKATREINDWVRRVTANKIPDLLPPSSLSPETSIFLGNALYFSGQWEKPFDGSVPEMESKFKLISGKEITTPMMQIESTFGYAYISALQSVGISIPFKDHRFEFIILKPDGSLRELENLLKTYPLNNLASDIKAYKRNVVLKMPKFKLDVNYDLVDVMRQLGINSLFDPSLVDLSGLTKGGEHHKVSRITHRTSLDVNEDGATAAAASGVEIYPISSPSIFAVDKPFVFMINDRLTGPVLLGHLVNPLESSMTY
ncbi:unnamed protein product [Allacma fusca]|uniref:Serpin domain-containing protein n=1 Tax=Allacma fusca TaxID=39272 RepID=A0A8J2P8T6_9HEXA|nr:unnamed protein product [Allacma fusca]